ncbi:hypothetical protein, partial [Tessaracoccus sp.]
DVPAVDVPAVDVPAVDVPAVDVPVDPLVTDSSWGAPLDAAPASDDTPVPVIHASAAPSDVSDGVARAQLRRHV